MIHGFAEAVEGLVQDLDLGVLEGYHLFEGILLLGVPHVAAAATAYAQFLEPCGVAGENRDVTSGSVLADAGAQIAAGFSATRQPQ